MEFTEKYYGKKLYYIPDTYDLSIIKEQRGYDPLFRDAEGKVFFELGGNKGYTSAYALTKGVKKIVSFEPEPLNIQYSKKNTEDGEDVTLYEGLGLPILEAMVHGCPVATSYSSGMIEAGGNAVEFFDPNSIQSISASIMKIVDSANYSDNLIKLGFEHVKNFTWLKCTKETFNIYKKII